MQHWQIESVEPAIYIYKTTTVLSGWGKISSIDVVLSINMLSNMHRTSQYNLRLRVCHQIAIFLNSKSCHIYIMPLTTSMFSGFCFPSTKYMNSIWHVWQLTPSSQMSELSTDIWMHQPDNQCLSTAWSVLTKKLWRQNIHCNE